MAVLYSVLHVQKRRRRDDTTVTNKKQWKSYLPRFNLNLKMKKRVRIRFTTSSTSCYSLKFDKFFYKLLSLGSIKPQRRRKTISHQEIANLQDGEELYEAVGDDPAYLEVVKHLLYRLLA